MDDPLETAERYLNRFGRDEDADKSDELAYILRQLIEHLKAERKKRGE